MQTSNAPDPAPKFVVDPQDLPPFASVKEVADLLRIHARTVRRWIDSGRLAVLRTAHRNGRIIVPRGSLLNLIDELAA